MKAEFRLVVMDKDAANLHEFYVMVAKPGGNFRGAKLEWRESVYDPWTEVKVMEPYVRKDP